MSSLEKKSRESAPPDCSIPVGTTEDAKPHLRWFNHGKVIGITFIFFFVLVLLTFMTPPFGNSFVQENIKPIVYQSRSTTANGRAVLDRVRLLYLYTVKDGKVDTTVISKEDLKRHGSVRIDGHVCGILVFCEDEMTVFVEGEKMSRIMKNGDGTFSLRHFGNLKLEEIKMTKFDRAYYEKALGEAAVNPKNEKFLKGGYSFFPEVMGDAVATSNQFIVTFESEGNVFRVPVEQQGYYPICTVSKTPQFQRGSLAFRYLGTRLDGLKQETGDFEQRLSAIAEGIDMIERTFNLDLVDTVNIVDYRGIHNAVTCDGGKEVWFYTDAFVKEPLPELKAIAEHETLHKFVEKQELTKNFNVRELFADLKGYDELSYERFLLITYGSLPPQGFSKGNVNHPFFAFINERNFLEGMKGGHSHANVAEMCTSFLHSLLFIDRLGTNLDRSLLFSEPQTGSRHLSFQEKSVVLDHYVKLLGIVAGSISGRPGSPSLAGNETAVVLNRYLQKANATRDERQVAMDGGLREDTRSL